MKFVNEMMQKRMQELLSKYDMKNTDSYRIEEMIRKYSGLSGLK